MGIFSIRLERVSIFGGWYFQLFARLLERQKQKAKEQEQLQKLGCC